MRRTKSGATLLHRGRALTKTHASVVGEMQAKLMAMALGVELPAVGESVDTSVPSGVLYRAVAISTFAGQRRKPCSGNS
jgi:hypothetical protein